MEIPDVCLLCLFVFLTFYYLGVASGMVTMAVLGFILALATYFWNVVVCYYREIKEEREDKLPIVIAEVPPPYENILNKY